MFMEKQITGIKVKCSSPDNNMAFVELRTEAELCELCRLWNTPVFIEIEKALEKEPEREVFFVIKEGVKYFFERPVEDEINVKEAIENERVKKQEE